MKCCICGKEIEESFYGNAILCSSNCYNEHFWQTTLDDSAVIINQVCYHIGKENSTDPFRGFGGRKFKIQMNDGKIIETDNLWCGGDIPDSHRDRMPDNAKFID